MARAGFEYDDNLTVEQSDQVSEQNDSAVIFEVEGVYKYKDSIPFSPEVSYAFYQSLYDDYSQYDMQSHSLSLAGAKGYADFNFGLDYSYSDLTLDSDGFLGMHYASPSLGYSVTPDIYLHTSYIFMDKDFRQDANSARDAVNHSLGADIFYFFMDNKAYLKAGYRLEDENADGAEYEYLGHILSASLQVMPFEKTKIRLVYKHHIKDYSNITQAIGTERDDTRNSCQLVVSRELYDNLELKLDYHYIANDSNVATNDYTENRVYAGLAVKY
jgi:hypothetical protein